jgi:hypothetical protein
MSANLMGDSPDPGPDLPDVPFQWPAQTDAQKAENAKRNAAIAADLKAHPFKPHPAVLAIVGNRSDADKLKLAMAVQRIRSTLDMIDASTEDAESKPIHKQLEIESAVQAILRIAPDLPDAKVQKLLNLKKDQILTR